MCQSKDEGGETTGKYRRRQADAVKMLPVCVVFKNLLQQIWLNGIFFPSQSETELEQLASFVLVIFVLLLKMQCSPVVRYAAQQLNIFRHFLSVLELHVSLIECLHAGLRWWGGVW